MMLSWPENLTSYLAAPCVLFQFLKDNYFQTLDGVGVGRELAEIGELLLAVNANPEDQRAADLLTTACSAEATERDSIDRM